SIVSSLKSSKDLNGYLDHDTTRLDCHYLLTQTASHENIPRLDHSRPENITHPPPHDGRDSLDPFPRRFDRVLVHPDTGSGDGIPGDHHSRPQYGLDPLPHGGRRDLNSSPGTFDRVLVHP